MIEEWRSLPGAKQYIVSSRGRIAHVLVGKNQNGYRLYELPAGARRISMFAHRAVALAFHGRPPKRGMDASPQDGNRKNLSPDNIQWQTRRETMRAKRRWGTQPFHEKHHWAKLTMEKAERIRRDFAARHETYVALAKRYRVSRNTIKRIITKAERGGWNPNDRIFHRNLGKGGARHDAGATATL